MLPDSDDDRNRSAVLGRGRGRDRRAERLRRATAREMKRQHLLARGPDMDCDCKHCS